MAQSRFQKYLVLAIVLVCSILVAAPVIAADKWHKFSAKEAMQSPLGQEKLTPEIKLFMSGQKHAKIVKKFGSFKSNKRSNAVGKSAQTSCERTFISALMALQDRAIREGGNAVVDIYSITQNNKFESKDQYSCIKGGFVVNVALMGTVVALK